MLVTIFIILYGIFSFLLYYLKYKELKSIKLILNKEKGKVKLDVFLIFIYYIYFINNYQREHFFSLDISGRNDFKGVVLIIFLILVIGYFIYSEFFQKKVDKVKKKGKR